MSDRQANGNLYDREIIICMPPAFASSALGRAVSALLQEKRWGMWRVADRAPDFSAAAAVAAGGGAGRRVDGGAPGAVSAEGVSVITFQRRVLTPADVRSVVSGGSALLALLNAIELLSSSACSCLQQLGCACICPAARPSRTATAPSPAPSGPQPASAQLTAPFEASAPVPCLLLLFAAPGPFITALTSRQSGGFAGLLARAAALHPDCSLQCLVVGLDSHCKAAERRDFGVGSFSAKEIQDAVLRLQLSAPALQLRKVANAEAAAQHILSLTRALGQQPYKRTQRDDALTAGKSGGSFDAAAAGGMRDLSAGARQAAQSLARLQGASGGQVWVSGWLARCVCFCPQAAAPCHETAGARKSMLPSWICMTSPLHDHNPPQAICREYGSLGSLTQALLAEAAAGREPGRLVSELRDVRGAQRRVGTVFGGRLAALLTSYDPDELVGQVGDE